MDDSNLTHVGDADVEAGRHEVEGQILHFVSCSISATASRDQRIVFSVSVHPCLPADIGVGSAVSNLYALPENLT